MAPGGRYGICGVTSGYKAELQMGVLFVRNITVFGVFMGRNQDLMQILEAVDNNQIRGVIHRIFPLEEVAHAHEVMEAREFFGKLIISVT
jgi:NADPH:quinone reductase-like Zn-dependent oxidoreductase